MGTFLFGRSITMTRSQNRPIKERRLRAASQLVGKLSFAAAHCRSDGRLSALVWEIAVHVGNRKWIIVRSGVHGEHERTKLEKVAQET